MLAAIVESQVDKEEEAMRAATGSPAAAAAAPAPEEAPAQRSQPGAGSDIDSKAAWSTAWTRRPRCASLPAVHSCAANRQLMRLLACMATASAL